MLFGNRKPKPGGLLGTLAMAEAQPERMGMFAEPAQPPMAQPMQAQMQGGMERFTQPPQPKGPGFFDQGGVGRHIAGSLGDSLMQMGGLNPLYAPMMQERRALQYKQQQDEAERQAKLEERNAQMYQPQKIGDNIVRLNPTTGQYETVFTAPRYNDTEADAALLDQRFGKGAGDQYLRNLGDPTVTVPLGNGMVYTGPRSGLGAAMQGQGGGGGLQPGTVEDGYRYKGGDPADKNNWEPVGGGVGNGTGGFRPALTGNQLDNQTMRSESGGRRYGPNGRLLTSPKGAMGEMQVMPDTARDPGFGIRPWDGRSHDDLARVGRDYRAVMQKRYGGDLAKMWAAYNAGPGRVDKAIRKYGPNWLAHMPRETQDYVRRNVGAVRGN